MASTINQLQLLQQNLQNLVLQKQQLHGQLTELNSALQGLKDTSQAYRIIGMVMLAASPPELSKELQEKKELAEIRLKNVEKQEHSLQQNLEKVQQEALAELQREKSHGTRTR